MENVRQHVGIVLQDTYLFSGTVRENIRFGRLNATDAEVEEAAKIAYAHNFIKYLPERYETMLASGGLNLVKDKVVVLSMFFQLLLLLH